MGPFRPRRDEEMTILQHLAVMGRDRERRAGIVFSFSKY